MGMHRVWEVEKLNWRGRAMAGGEVALLAKRGFHVYGFCRLQLL